MRGASHLLIARFTRDADRNFDFGRRPDWWYGDRNVANIFAPASHPFEREREKGSGLFVLFLMLWTASGTEC